MKQKLLKALIAGSCALLIGGNSMQASFGDDKHSAAPPYEIAAPLTEPFMFAPGIVSTPDDEFGGAFTPDGKTVYFDRTVLRHYLYIICESHFVNGRWSQPEVAPFSG